MSFGNNVLFYRKKYGITQEELAEKLDVTRQTVSRWETDGAFPDMEKLLALCELFRCDMDTLVRGDAAARNAREYRSNIEVYDRHMNAFAVQITAGVCLILAGVTAMLFLAAAGIPEVAGVVTLFVCITVAVALFVAGGIAHGNFMRENPRVEKYPKERVSAFRRKLPFLISGATALILIGLIAVVAMTWRKDYAPKGFTVERWESLAAGVFLLCIAVAVGVYVYSGMQSSKYDVKSYNKECRREGYTAELDADMGIPEGESEGAVPDVEDPDKSARERLSGAICGVIMMSATAIFLLLGFLGNRWHPGWVVFPVGGILCGIVSEIVEATGGKK